jgi:hypothetical protein
MTTHTTLNYHTQTAKEIDKVDEAIAGVCDNIQYVIIILGLMILAMMGIARLLKPKRRPR